MTGTMPFMAIQVLRGLEDTYRHDLESLFYVLLWMCGRRAWEKGFQCSIRDQPRKRIFQKWYGDSANKVEAVKQGYMHVEIFEDVLHEFDPALNCIKPLCKKVRTVLFPPTEEETDGRKVGIFVPGE